MNRMKTYTEVSMVPQSPASPPLVKKKTFIEVQKILELRRIEDERAISVKLQELKGKDRRDILNSENALYNFIFSDKVRKK